MKSFTIPLFLAISTIGQVQIFAQDTTSSIDYKIGESIVTVERKCFFPCNSKVVFINVHDNEKTSISAAEDYLMQNKGQLVRFNNNNERNVAFRLKGKTYNFDPNRIYSDEGRKATIRSAARKLSTDAESEVAYLAHEFLINYIDSSSLVVAIHNNSDSALSILTYQEDQVSKKHFGNVYINPLMDPDDFILTNDTTIYNQVKDKNINVVWENADSTADDGSLSIYSGRNAIPYINIEAEHNHLDEQCGMLMALHEIIEGYKKRQPVKSLKGAKRFADEVIATQR